MKKAVCVGINDYPGRHNDLNGCVNDSNDWAALLSDTFHFDDVNVIHNSNATISRVLSSLESLVANSNDGDVLVFTFSGHGTWVYDHTNSDESDNRDEALCAYDGNIIDDEIRSIISKLESNAILTVISDTCHSGTVTRTLLEREKSLSIKRHPQNVPSRKYMPPHNDADAIKTYILPIKKRLFYPDSYMKEILITGCNALEYSYDAFIGGKFNGAMTANAINIIRSNPDLTYKEFHRQLRTILPSTQFPQSPQLEGSQTNINRKLFS